MGLGRANAMSPPAISVRVEEERGPEIGPQMWRSLSKFWLKAKVNSLWCKSSSSAYASSCSIPNPPRLQA